MVEAQPAVVHAVEPGLRSVVADGDTGHRVAVVVADRHQPGVHAPALALGDQLGEDDGHPAVLGGVADVVLAGGLVRGVQVEAAGLRVVGARGAQLLDVGAVPGLGHGEAARQVEAHDVAQVGVVVPLGAEQLHGTAEQPPLDAGLDHERQVAERQHLDRGDRAAGVVVAAVLLREAQPDAAKLSDERCTRDFDHVQRLWKAALHALGPGWTVNGSTAHRYHGNLNIRREGVDAARLIADLRDIAFSLGSACASGSGRPSHVLRGLGLDYRETRSSIRLGFGRYTTQAELVAACHRLAKAALEQEKLDA